MLSDYCVFHLYFIHRDIRQNDSSEQGLSNCFFSLFREKCGSWGWFGETYLVGKQNIDLGDARSHVVWADYKAVYGTGDEVDSDILVFMFFGEILYVL